jgi:hypothetical protein
MKNSIKLINCYKTRIRKFLYSSLFLNGTSNSDFIPTQDTDSSMNLISELTFRQRVGTEEIDSDFFHITYVQLQLFVNEKIGLFDLVAHDELHCISTEFMQIARIRVRNDLGGIFGKLNFDNFQSALKLSNRYRSVDILKQSIWNNLQTTYLNMLFVCNKYELRIKKCSFEKHAIDENFTNRIIDAFIEAIRYDGVFVSDNQMRYDLWWICVLSSIRKGLSSLTARNRLLVYEKQLLSLSNYEKGICGVDFIQTPQLRFFLVNEIEDIRLRLKSSGRPKYNYGAHIEGIRKMHQYLYKNGFTNTSCNAFVKCWEKGIGRINWLQKRTALVQFHEILLVYTNLLDLVDFENFIIDNYSINGSTDFDIKSIVKKKKGIGSGERALKKFGDILAVIDTLSDDYRKSTGVFRGE